MSGSMHILEQKTAEEFNDHQTKALDPTSMRRKRRHGTSSSICTNHATIRQRNLLLGWICVLGSQLQPTLGQTTTSFTDVGILADPGLATDPEYCVPSGFFNLFNCAVEANVTATRTIGADIVLDVSSSTVSILCQCLPNAAQSSDTVSFSDNSGCSCQAEVRQLDSVTGEPSDTAQECQAYVCPTNFGAAAFNVNCQNDPFLVGSITNPFGATCSWMDCNFGCNGGCADSCATSQPSCELCQPTTAAPVTVAPTQTPTLSPAPTTSQVPSGSPSELPTASSSPSVTPSAAPTVSIAPSTTPTTSDQPSSLPSVTPTTSQGPSSSPSEAPSASIPPSVTPTASQPPSASPSEVPSVSRGPSASPDQTTTTPQPNNGPPTQVVEMGVMTVSFVPSADLQGSLLQSFLDNLTDYLLSELRLSFANLLSIQLVAYPLAVVGNDAVTFLNILPRATFAVPASTTQLYIVNSLTFAQQEATARYIAAQQAAAAQQQESWADIVQTIDMEGPVSNGVATYDSGARELSVTSHHPSLRSYSAIAAQYPSRHVEPETGSE